MSDMKLSERVRPDCEAAPWVTEEIKRLEAKLEALESGPDYGDGPEFEGWAERSAQQPQSAEAVVPQWRYDALIQHAKHQDKVIAKLREEKNTAWLYEQKEVWFWQGDGEDYPESLCCPVVIKADDLRAILTAPRQPEGEGLEVVGYRVSVPDEPELGQWLDESAENEPQMCLHEPLCRLSDHLRAIAELREECKIQRNSLAGARNQLRANRLETERLAVDWLAAVAERDTLRQQLAEANDNTNRWHEIACKQSKRADGIAAQRDKLAGLLRDARLKMGYMLNYGEWYSPEELLERIDAALAEVDK